MPMLTSVKYKDLYKEGYLAPPIRNVLTLNGVSQHITIPTILAGTEITLTVKPLSGGNTGLPAGCPALVDNEIQTVTFTLSEDLAEIGRNGAAYFNGNPLDMRVSDIHHRFDEGWRGANNQVLVNYATDLGEELVVNGDFSDGLNGWTAINNVSDVDGAAYLVEDGGLSAISQGILNTSKQYLTKVNALNVSGALRLETKGNTFYPLKGGCNTIAHTPFNGNLYIKTHQAGTSGYVDNVSVKQADGYGTYIGLTEASWSEQEVNP